MSWSTALDRISRWLLVAAVVLVPLVFAPQTWDLINLSKITLLAVLVLLAAGARWMSGERNGWRSSRSSAVRIPVLSTALLVVTAVATALSPNRTLSVVGTPGRYEGLGSLAVYVAVVWITVALYRRHVRDLRALLRAGGIATAAAATYVLLQKVGIDIVEWVVAGGAPYPIGPLGNSTFTSVFLGMGTSFLVYLVITAPDVSSRVAWIVAGGVNAVALWFTQGRAGMAAAVASVVFVVMFRSSIRAWIKLVTVAGALLALALAPFALAPSTNGTGVTRTETLDYRAELWTAAWNMTLDRPVVGWGPASFAGQMGTYRTPTEARQQGLLIADSPHNVFLTWSTSAGAIGIALFVALIGTALIAVSTRAPTMDTHRRTMLAAFGGCLVSYLVGCMFTINVPPLAFLSWLALGAITVLGSPTATVDEGDQPPDRGKQIARSTSTTKRVLAGSVVGVVIALVLGPLRADYAAGQAEKRSGDGWSLSTLELYDKAIAINPREAAYRVLLARYLDRVAETVTAPLTPLSALRRAASLYNEALGIQPFNPALMVDGARANARLASAGDTSAFEKANRLMERAARVDPLDPEIYDAHGELLALWGSRSRGDAARQLLRRSSHMSAQASRLRHGGALQLRDRDRSG